MKTTKCIVAATSKPVWLICLSRSVISFGEVRATQSNTKSLLHAVLVWIVIACVADSTFFTRAHAQVAPGAQPEFEWTAFWDIRDPFPFEPIGYDAITLEAVSPTDGSVDLSQLNTPEQIEQRKLALLAMTEPEEFFRRFPKSPEQLEAEAASRETVLHPLTLDEKRQRQTSEENLADDAAIAAILTVNQVSDTAPTTEPPGNVSPANP
jgi:hypothetical protein